MSKKIDEREVLDTDNPVVNDEWKDKITFPKHYEKVASKLTKKQDSIRLRIIKDFYLKK